MSKRILVIEDEPAIQELLRINLSMAGYEVTQALDVDHAMASMLVAVPDLVLVDWNMPGRSGVSFVRALRSDPVKSLIPVIMLTARDDELDKVLAFSAGVDDYVTKPFNTRELLARVHAHLRRSLRDVEQVVVEVDGLRLNHDQRRVTVGANTITLGPTEYRLLHFLMKNPMRVHTRGQLLDHVWGDSAELQERTVDAYVGRLRCLIEEAGHHVCIETVRSAGYRFVKRNPAISSNGSAEMLQPHG
jgi:two-component system, OmpR family, phosphate regulon response regulator PhoB